MGIAHILYVFAQFVRKAAVIEKLVFVTLGKVFFPAAEMHFVH